MQKCKMAFAAMALVGVFALCGMSVVGGQMDLKAAIAVALASLTSVGSLAGIYKSDD